MNEKDLPAMYSTVFRYLLVVLLVNPNPNPNPNTAI